MTTLSVTQAFTRAKLTMTTDNHTAATKRWSVERANTWFTEQPWPVGCNFLPSTAVNFVDMWHPETFDPQTIDRELGWAADIGYNSMRINIQYILWADDPKGMMGRIERYLTIADSHGISTVLCLFDDCEFSGDAPSTDRQPDPIPGVHNSRALASPGRHALMDDAQWPGFKDYVTAIVGALAQDKRVLFWDLYNEPGNVSVFANGEQDVSYGEAMKARSFELCKNAFAWARAQNPVQPITSGAWHMSHAWKDGEEEAKVFDNPIDQFMLDASDIISFHAYVKLQRFKKIISALEPLGRPLMCTEWLARTAGSYPTEQLPVFHAEKIGCYQWGFANGRTQTHIPWPALKAKVADYDEDKSEWFHDVVHADGTPYNVDEIALFRSLAGKGAHAD